MRDYRDQPERLDRGYQSQPQPYPYHDDPRGYYAPGVPSECEAVPVEEPRTSIITQRLDYALKNTDQLIAAVLIRADSLFGPEPKQVSLGNEKTPPPMLDCGIMDRIDRQTRELERALEVLGYQFRRFNQL